MLSLPSQDSWNNTAELLSVFKENFGRSDHMVLLACTSDVTKSVRTVRRWLLDANEVLQGWFEVTKCATWTSWGGHQEHDGLHRWLHHFLCGQYHPHQDSAVFPKQYSLDYQWPVSTLCFSTGKRSGWNHYHSGIQLFVFKPIILGAATASMQPGHGELSYRCASAWIQK